jgi:hypothetical protein
MPGSTMLNPRRRLLLATGALADGTVARWRKISVLPRWIR